MAYATIFFGLFLLVLILVNQPVGLDQADVVRGVVVRTRTRRAGKSTDHWYDVKTKTGEKSFRRNRLQIPIRSEVIAHVYLGDPIQVRTSKGLLLSYEDYCNEELGRMRYSWTIPVMFVIGGILWLRILRQHPVPPVE